MDASTLLKCRGCQRLLPSQDFYRQVDSPTGHRSKCKKCFCINDYASKKRRKAKAKSSAVDGLLVAQNFAALSKLIQDRQGDLSELKIRTRLVGGIEPNSDGITFRRIGADNNVVEIRGVGEPVVREANKTTVEDLAGYLAARGIEVVP